MQRNFDVYRRYFRVTSGPLFDAVVAATEVNRSARKEYGKILDSIGAKCDQWYQIDDRLVGLIFGETPDKNLFKKVRNGWMPKKNNKKAKAIADRIASVKTENINDLLSVVGLSSFPRIFAGGKCYSATLTDIPSDPPVIYVCVPWFDVDPVKLKAYKADKNSRDSNYEAILWEPPADMEEVKGWEVDKAIEEWNASVKENKKAA